MHLTIDFTEEEENALAARAEARGVPVETLVKSAVESMLQVPELPRKHPVSLAEFERAMDEIASLIPPGTPPLSDYAMSRESIYFDNDDGTPRKFL